MKLVDVKELGYSAEENTGEVCFRGAGLMDGYFNDPELTSQTVDQQVNLKIFITNNFRMIFRVIDTEKNFI